MYKTKVHFRIVFRKQWREYIYIYIYHIIYKERQGSAEKFLSLPRSPSPQNSDVWPFSDIFGSEFSRELITPDRQIYICPVELCLWAYIDMCMHVNIYKKFLVSPDQPTQSWFGYLFTLREVGWAENYSAPSLVCVFVCVNCCIQHIKFLYVYQYWNMLQRQWGSHSTSFPKKV